MLKKYIFRRHPFVSFFTAHASYLLMARLQRRRLRRRRRRRRQSQRGSGLVASLAGPLLGLLAPLVIKTLERKYSVRNKMGRTETGNSRRQKAWGHLRSANITHFSTGDAPILSRQPPLHKF